MPQISSRINARSDEFREKQAAMSHLVADVQQKLNKIVEGGGPVAWSAICLAVNWRRAPG